uniref:hypothetical protein n=1 Tax=Niveispirillum sp. TaxID=1917217 RepID=UPI003BA586B0
AAFLRAVPELEARGRRPLVDTRAGAVVGLARDGLARLADARRARGRVPPGARAAFLSGWQTEALLRQVLADPRRVTEGRLGLSEFARRGGLVWAAITGRW